MRAAWLALVLCAAFVPAAGADDEGWEFRCDAGRCSLSQADFQELVVYVRALERRLTELQKGMCS